MRKILILFAILGLGLFAALPAMASTRTPSPPRGSLQAEFAGGMRHPHISPLSGHLSKFGKTTVVKGSQNFGVGKKTGKAGTSSDYYDVNWSGYTAIGDTVPFREVQATYTVPNISGSDCNTTTTDDATIAAWVGLDGVYPDDTVEQSGVIMWCPGGGYGPQYYMFYENYPAGEVYGNTVSPGDVVTSSVYMDKDTGEIEYKVDDTTDGDDWLPTPSITSTVDRSSAEAILEGVGGTAMSFPNVTFSTTTVTDQDSNRSAVGPSSWWNSDAMFDVAGTTNGPPYENCIYPVVPLSPASGTSSTDEFFAGGTPTYCTEGTYWYDDGDSPP